MKLIDSEDEYQNQPDVDIENINGDKFKNVSFAYDTDLVLKNSSLR